MVSQRIVEQLNLLGLSKHVSALVEVSPMTIRHGTSLAIFTTNSNKSTIDKSQKVSYYLF